MTQKSSATDPNATAARQAGLRYVDSNRPGYTRIPKGKKFVYLDQNAKPLKDAAALQRIEQLVIPPAWKEVWICPHANGHLQVTGYDERGRKQYLYHPEWTRSRKLSNYNRMMLFAAALPAIREAAEKGLAMRKVSREKVLATAVSLLDKAFLRIGNAEYARTNKSFGLTTLRDKHVKIKGEKIIFDFVGKKGVPQQVEIEDARLAQIVKKCRDIPGYELFQYYDEDGNRHTIESGDVNEWLRTHAGNDFTAKDFRTWGGSVHALEGLMACLPTPENEKDRKKQVVEIIKLVSARLGNTTTVCRKYYIHPHIIENFECGNLDDFCARYARLRNGRYLSKTEKMLVKALEELENGK